MPTFKYTAKTPEGKSVSGTLVADSAGDVVGELRRKNLVVLDMKESAGKSSKGLALLDPSKGNVKPGRAKKDELVVFTRQLATMISSGITLLDSLEILAEQILNPGFRKTVKVIAADVRGGSDFSQALNRHPKCFKSIYVSMVKAGEVSGQLDEILIRLAEYRSLLLA